MSKKQNILITGGAGYIGSHFVRLLERAKVDFVIVDNFSTGQKEFVKNKKWRDKEHFVWKKENYKWVCEE